MCQGIGNALRDSKEFGGRRAKIGVGRQGAGRGLGDDAERWNLASGQGV